MSWPSRAGGEINCAQGGRKGKERRKERRRLPSTENEEKIQIHPLRGILSARKTGQLANFSANLANFSKKLERGTQSGQFIGHGQQVSANKLATRPSLFSLLASFAPLVRSRRSVVLAPRRCSVIAPLSASCFGRTAVLCRISRVTAWLSNPKSPSADEPPHGAQLRRGLAGRHGSVACC